MLTPKDFKLIEKQANKLYGNLELEIIQEIAERIANVGYANTVVINDIRIAQEAGILYEDVINLVAKYNEASASQIKEIFETAGAKSIASDDKIYTEAGLNPKGLSSSMLQLLEATAKKTQYNLDNLVMTTANTSQKQFIEAMNKSYLEVSTGIKSYSQSIIDTIKDISDQGAYVEYPSGQHRSIESAVRMNVVTSVNQTSGKLQLIRADEMGWDLMELSAHSGARPEHAEWQGKIVSRSGRKGYLSLEDIGYGEITGFQGANCRHTWFPYYKDSTFTYTDDELDRLKNETVYYNGEKISKYDATQIQRAIERKIRKDKKDIAGLQGILKSNNEDNELKDAVNRKLININSKLNSDKLLLDDFISQIEFKKDNNRLNIGNILINKQESDIILRNKSGIRGIYPKSQKEINDICNNELKNIKFPAKVVYNARVTNGRTRYTRYSWGELKEIISIEIGKQQKDSKEFVIDTLLHEKLEAKILITNTKKYKALDNTSEGNRHKYINEVITRYFRMKGWNNGDR